MPRTTVAGHFLDGGAVTGGRGGRLPRIFGILWARQTRGRLVWVAAGEGAVRETPVSRGQHHCMPYVFDPAHSCFENVMRLASSGPKLSARSASRACASPLSV